MSKNPYSFLAEHQQIHKLALIDNEVEIVV